MTVVYDLNDLRVPKGMSYEVVNLLERLGVEDAEERTYTLRYEIRDEATRRRVASELLKVRDGDLFLRKLRANDWRLSVMVDARECG
jgi:hypothetical protein